MLVQRPSAHALALGLAVTALSPAVAAGYIAPDNVDPPAQSSAAHLLGDHPSAYGAAGDAPTVPVVRTERTIVRDVDQELPIAVAGLAVVIAAAGTGFAISRTRRVQRRLMP